MNKIISTISLDESLKKFVLNNPDKVVEILEEYGKYQMLEEELGIDLITLFKAIDKEVVYVKVGKKIYMAFVLYAHCLFKGGTLIVSIRMPNGSSVEIYKLEDYGETWALTKEELEKEIKNEH